MTNACLQIIYLQTGIHDIDPIAIHTARRIQVSSGKDNIIIKQMTILVIATKGTQGVLKG